MYVAYVGLSNRTLVARNEVGTYLVVINSTVLLQEKVCFAIFVCEKYCSVCC